MLDATAVPGWYGKIASLGDFASRRLAPDWIDACDGWLSRSIASSRSTLGEQQWLETYLAAPLWRFAWAPGVIDRRWWFGVLMPSCDNVGRYFPLVVAQTREQPPQDRTGLDHLDRWWTDVADAAMRTLEDDASVQELESRLAALPPWPVARPGAPAAPCTVDERVRVSAHLGAGLADLAGAWASHEILARLVGCTLWSQFTDAGMAPTLTFSPGLPPPERFVDLLSGRW